MTKSDRSSQDRSSSTKDKVKKKKKHSKRRRREEKTSTSTTIQPSSPSILHSAFHQCQVRFSLALHPSDLGNTDSAIRKHLGRLLLQYVDAPLHGIVLSAQRQQNDTTKSRSNETLLLDDQAAIVFPHVWVKAVVWRPVRHRVTCRITHVYASHWTALVLGYFTASILMARKDMNNINNNDADEDADDSFVYVAEEEVWMDRTSGRRVMVGSRVEITCARLLEGGGIVSIEGTRPKLLIEKTSIKEEGDE